MSIQQQINEAMEHFNLSKEENQEIHIGRRIDDFDTTLENSVSAIKAIYKSSFQIKTPHTRVVIYYAQNDNCVNRQHKNRPI